MFDLSAVSPDRTAIGNFCRFIHQKILPISSIDAPVLSMD
jgi:hypothetical protein